MAASYNRLWKLLIDKSIKKSTLRELTGIGTTTLAKLGKNEHVSMEVIEKICSALGVQPGDIMEFIPDVPETPKEKPNTKRRREKAVNGKRLD